MPQAYKGRRIALTVRLPLDVYTAAARAAAAREWSLSHYVADCVVRVSAQDGGHNTWRARRALRLADDVITNE